MGALAQQRPVESASRNREGEFEQKRPIAFRGNPYGSARPHDRLVVPRLARQPPHGTILHGSRLFPARPDRGQTIAGGNPPSRPPPARTPAPRPTNRRMGIAAGIRLRTNDLNIQGRYLAHWHLVLNLPIMAIRIRVLRSC